MNIKLDNNILNSEFDVFIAYHGTESSSGSLTKAREIYNILRLNGLNCFFFPETNPGGAFSDTPTVASHSKLFLLVANNSIPLNDRNEIVNPGLFNEIKSFYNKSFNDIGSAGNARVYVYGGLTAEKANSFHVVFNGAAHFVEGNNNIEKDKLLRWAQGSISKNKNAGLVTPDTMEVHRPVNRLKLLKEPRFLEGIWTVSGDFSRFQGDKKHRYISSGRLVLLWNTSFYKAVYCYSVSREYRPQAQITTLCEGAASFASSTEETLTVTCDVISRTSPKKSINRNRQFQLYLKPNFNDDSIVNSMTADFITMNTDGILTFTRHI